MKMDMPVLTILATFFPDLALRRRIEEILRAEPEPAGLVTARAIDGTGIFPETTLIVTPDAIGYGWPMSRVLWKPDPS